MVMEYEIQKDLRKKGMIPRGVKVGPVEGHLLGMKKKKHMEMEGE